jgi:hypothetical protein
MHPYPASVLSATLLDQNQLRTVVEHFFLQGERRRIFTCDSLTPRSRAEFFARAFLRNIGVSGQAARGHNLAPTHGSNHSMGQCFQAFSWRGCFFPTLARDFQY